MRALLVLAAVILAGCHAPTRVEPGPLGRVGAPCVLPYLNVTPDAAAPGVPLVVEAALVNCGERPLAYWPSGCRTPPGLAVTLTRLGETYLLADGQELPLHRLHVGPCGPPMLEPERTFAPGESLRAAWRWNGSLSRELPWWQPLVEPTPGYRVVTTTEVSPPMPGGHTLELGYFDRASNTTWSRTASLWLGDPSQPVAQSDGMSAWRPEPWAVARGGNGTVAAHAPQIVSLAANASLESRFWPLRDAELLGIDAAGDHYAARFRLRLAAIDETFDIVIPVTEAGDPLRAPVPGLPDCRESTSECEFHVRRDEARAFAAREGEPRLVWHARGNRGTFAWDVGGVIVDANDGRILP